MHASQFGKSPRFVAQRRLSRRRVARQGGVGLATSLVASTAGHIEAEEATPMTSGDTPLAGLAGLAFTDPESDGQFLRALHTIGAAGADVGECFVTARRIVPGDHESWLTE